ncbi:YegP family protein [Uruburuella testudinis]|uniref:YegP family protein n=1 Tax=Uruburuella testudinis TaxID=1282863 RepID=A0ABY4DQN2_9NEIS|nr:YegP family protein [Uruburuella testudinis]UOO81365.1 YegP family protein [Uruburuella testudinis]
MATFELTRSDNGEFHFNFLDNNEKTILRSEQYGSKAAAQNGIESVRSNAGNDERYEYRESSAGKFYFNLKAANGQIVGTSMMYDDDAARRTAAATVKSSAAQAGVIEDL